MPRRPTPEDERFVPIYFRVPPELKRRFQALVDDQQQSAFLRRILEDALRLPTLESQVAQLKGDRDA